MVKQYKVTATTNRFKLSISFILIGLMSLFYPKFAREVVTYWSTHKKQLDEQKIDELHK